MKKYTHEEFMNEFGNFPVLLTSYFKFQFGYSGQMDNRKLYLYVGGDSDTIYEFEPIINAPTPVKDLIDNPGIQYAYIYDENNVQIGEYRGESW